MAMTELQALLDAAVDAIVMIDDRGTITTFNAAAERLFGYTTAEVLGKQVDLLMPEKCSVGTRTATPFRSRSPWVRRVTSVAGASSASSAICLHKKPRRCALGRSKAVLRTSGGST
jgi:PAS domain-containing protein